MSEHNSQSCVSDASMATNSSSEPVVVVSTKVQVTDPTPNDLNKNGNGKISDWFSSRRSVAEIKVFAMRKETESVKGLNATPVIWVPVTDTQMMCASVRSSDIMDRSQLAKTTQLVTEADQIRDDAPGQIDFWPARVLATTTSTKPAPSSTVGKTKGRWEVVEDWRSATVKDIKDKVVKQLNCTHFGAAARYGRPALRALVAPSHYARVSEVAKQLGLQFARVTAPNMPAGKLTVKAITGCNEALAGVTRTAIEFITSEFKATIGRVDDSPGAVSVVVYTDRKLTAVDAFSYLSEDGFRIAFAPSAGHDYSISNKEIEDNLATFPVPEPKVVAEGASAGSEDEVAAMHTVMEHLRSVVSDTHENAMTATKKTYKSWSALGLSREVVTEAMQVMKDLYSNLGDSLTAREEYGVWANTCPTPAAVAAVASSHAKVGSDRLTRELQKELPPAKLAAVAEERSRQIHHTHPQPLSRTYADAARRRPADKQVTHRK